MGTVVKCSLLTCTSIVVFCCLVSSCCQLQAKVSTFYAESRKRFLRNSFGPFPSFLTRYAGGCCVVGYYKYTDRVIYCAMVVGMNLKLQESMFL